MIRTLSICIFSLSFLPMYGQITVFPYFQNFESFATCTNVCQGPCPLAANWVNPSGTGDIGSWVVNSGGTPTSNTGPSEDADPGMVGGKYVYIESSNSCVGGKKVFLESPVFDFRNNPFPVLEFYSHLYGSGQGELHVDADTNGVTVMDIIPPIRGNEDQWKRNSVCLEAFAGVRSVKFRFRAVTGFSETSDMAIDAVSVFEANLNDVYAKDVFVCGDGINEEVAIEFGNLGKNIASNVTARYSIDNGAFLKSSSFLGRLPGVKNPPIHLQKKLISLLLEFIK